MVAKKEEGAEEGGQDVRGSAVDCVPEGVADGVGAGHGGPQALGQG